MAARRACAPSRPDPYAGITVQPGVLVIPRDAWKRPGFRPADLLPALAWTSSPAPGPLSCTATPTSTRPRRSPVLDAVGALDAWERNQAEPKAHVIQGDMRDVLWTLPGNHFDSVVTDPPYHLTSITKRFGKPDAAPAKSNGPSGVYARASAGFMGQQWDGGDLAFQAETWAEVYRVLKPGGHLLAFGGSRTYHRLACAIEDAGFEVRDQIMWLYGSGFPKSRNIGRDVDGYDGWGTALKPAHEPIVVARKPLTGTVAANVLAWGTGAINVDGCRVAGAPAATRFDPAKHGHDGWRMNATGAECADRAAQVGGRWPANVIHDGSDEVLAAFPDAPGQQAAISTTAPSPKTSNVYGKMRREGEASADSDNEGAVGFKMTPGQRRLDTGSAARFFYCAKASKADRAGSKHPTVKPIALMRYLCRLVTPHGGTVLDPFAGSGTTLQAARDEGFRAIGIEREEQYVADIRRRLGETA